MNLIDESDVLPETEPWGIEVIDATPTAVLDHVIGNEAELLARVRHNRLIDRVMNCDAHSLHTNLSYWSREFGQITVGEMYHAVNQRGTEFIVAVRVISADRDSETNQAELDFEACQELFPDLTPRVVHVELSSFSWGDIVVLYRLRQLKRGITCDDEIHFRLVSHDAT